MLSRELRVYEHSVIEDVIGIMGSK